MNSFARNKIWLVIQYEFRKTVFSWRYLFGLLSPFLVLVVSVALGILVLLVILKKDPVGVVDNARLMETREENSSSFVLFANEDEARNALERKKIQAYYVIPANFEQHRIVRLVCYKRPSLSIQTSFEDLIRQRLLVGYSEEVIQPLLRRTFVITYPVGEKSEQAIAEILHVIFAMMAGYFLITVVMSCSGYIMHAVSEEKANRVMEILINSVSPGQLLLGKIVAQTSAGLLQMLSSILGLASILPLLLSLDIPLLQVFINWQKVVVFILLALPNFFIVVSLLAILAVKLKDVSDGQIVLVYLMVLQILPLFLFDTISSNPNGVISTIFTFLPFSSLLTVLLRFGLGNIMPWQIGLVVLGLNLLVIFFYRFARKVFLENLLKAGSWMGWRKIMSMLYHRIKVKRYASY